MLPETGLLRAGDPRFRTPLDVIGKRLLMNGFLKHVDADDFGNPSNALLTRAFWVHRLAVARWSTGRSAEPHPLRNAPVPDPGGATMARVVIVSNRVPIPKARGASAGGLAVALRDLLEAGRHVVRLERPSGLGAVGAAGAGRGAWRDLRYD